jgi:hypothetical protein
MHWKVVNNFYVRMWLVPHPILLWQTYGSMESMYVQIYLTLLILWSFRTDHFLVFCVFIYVQQFGNQELFFSLFMSLHKLVIYVSHLLFPYIGDILTSLHLLLYLLVSKFPIEIMLTEFKLHRFMYSSLPKISQIQGQITDYFSFIFNQFHCLWISCHLGFVIWHISFKPRRSV